MAGLLSIDNPPSPWRELLVPYLAIGGLTFVYGLLVQCADPFVDPSTQARSQIARGGCEWLPGP